MSDDKVFGKCAWRLIPFMMRLYIVNYLDRVNVGFAALTMNKDLGFSPSVFGFGAGIFFLSYALCQVPSSVMLQRVCFESKVVDHLPSANVRFARQSKADIRQASALRQLSDFVSAMTRQFPRNVSRCSGAIILKRTKNFSSLGLETPLKINENIRAAMRS